MLLEVLGTSYYSAGIGSCCMPWVSFEKYDPIVSTDDEKKHILVLFCLRMHELKVGFRKLRKKWGSSKDLISPAPSLSLS